MVKLVTQEQGMGCGVACVASLLGCSYKKALSFFKFKEGIVTRGYWCHELVDALKKAGKLYKHAKVSQQNKKFLRDVGVIVFVKRSKRYPEGHHLLRTSKGWMNPWHNHPNIAPAKAGYDRRLPGTAEWIIYPLKN